MPDLQAPSTNSSRPITQPARFQFTVTWSSLYAWTPASQKALEKSRARSCAVEKTPPELDAAWAMVVPKMYRPLPRRRRVLEIAPVPAPAAAPRTLQAAPRIAPQPAAARARQPVPLQKILAGCAAGVAFAVLTVSVVRHSSAPKPHPAAAQPQTRAALKFPAVPPAAAQGRLPKHTLETARSSRISVRPPQRLVRRAVPPSAAPATAPPAHLARIPASTAFARPADAPGALVSSRPAPARLDPFETDEFESSLVISKVKPAYPEVARLALVQGTVRLKAVIGADGTVESLDLESGPALLAPAAIEAVRQWRFLPATRNGKRVEDETHIDVKFALVK